ncbi:hypothetical protein [Williamsia sp. DF01-3]|uniref:hypothetical protein n=1 Tax=Williamsia sp. DF01-3 TaxID=2934157 RepID=UPI001FF488AC|nr:hypothetical protein [Williamsia sp. DF01-3]MCK0516739.1 hypothetical protein [Williamsia sp. DF01-3]
MSGLDNSQPVTDVSSLEEAGLGDEKTATDATNPEPEDDDDDPELVDDATPGPR